MKISHIVNRIIFHTVKKSNSINCAKLSLFIAIKAIFRLGTLFAYYFTEQTVFSNLLFSVINKCLEFLDTYFLYLHIQTISWHVLCNIIGIEQQFFRSPCSFESKVLDGSSPHPHNPSSTFFCFDIGFLIWQQVEEIKQIHTPKEHTGKATLPALSISLKR